MTSHERGAGPGAGPPATGVEPSAAEPAPSGEHTGEAAVPLGSPVDADELRELKRRAEQPAPPSDRGAAGDEDR